MQGRMNLNLERKGPHKSMHCKFCKPPGVTVEDKTPYSQLETTTKIHLVHEGADLKVFDVHDEPGMLSEEREACICILEGDNPCTKCLPDKNRPPQKKTVCRCPKGAKPHPSMYDSIPKQRKVERRDDEFWWEKYSREHDALTKETWAAYMAQRKKDKKLAKCQREKGQAMVVKKFSFRPNWFQQLSCQQVLYVEFLSTAIRLDSDENVTDRTYFVLGGLGLYPRPSRKIVKKCITFCHYNALHFLNQLLLLTKDIDPFNEKQPTAATDSYTWNESLVMNAICHLELPAVLREIMDRMPPLPREKVLPQIPYPIFPKPKKIKYETPYDEPLWKESLNWVEKNLIDKLNRARAHMDTKRVKIPPLALVRRPSLIDNRPPFLAQIEANERAARRLVKEKPKKVVRKHRISTFNSAVDVTAIAGIEASDVSTTDKADTEDICVFLREPKREEVVEEDREAEELIESKEVKFTVDEEELHTQVNRIRDFSMYGEYSGDDDMSFKTPPKRESGTTIQTPCPPPDSTPGPPVTHYERAKREAGIIKKELCIFHPMESSSTQTIKDGSMIKTEDVEEKLKSAAEKLKQFANEVDEEEADKPKQKKKRKKRKCSKKRKKSKRRRKTVVEIPDFTDNGGEEGEGERVEEEEEKEDEEDVMEAEEVEEFRSFRSRSSGSRKSSEISDPDPDPDVEWPPRPICFLEEEEEKPKKKKKKCKKKKCKRKKKSLKKKKTKKEETSDMVLREESEEYLKKMEPMEKEEKVTMTECYAGEFDYLYKEKETKEAETKKSEAEEFTGDPMDLVKAIVKDLAEEGFICASFKNFHEHENVRQLIGYLQGIVLTEKFRSQLHTETKIMWDSNSGPKKPAIPQLKISPQRAKNLTWNDKKWLSRVAKKKLDEAYFNQAQSRASSGKELFLSLQQGYIGTDRYLKAFYAYMVSKYEDCILKGI